MALFSHNHYITICDVCGSVINQCRCYIPFPNTKEVQYVICDSCKKKDSVWIVYRSIPFRGARYLKVEAVVSTEEMAIEYTKQLDQTLDSMFGIVYQQWFLDDNFELFGKRREVDSNG